MAQPISGGATEASAPLVLLNLPFHPILQAQLEADPRIRVRLVDRFVLSDSDAGLAGEVAGLLVNNALHDFKVDGALLSRFPALKVVSNHGVGVDHIDLPAARARGLAVGNTPDVLTAATADMAWALLLAVARNVVEGDAICRAPATTSFGGHYTWLGRDVGGATLGVVGCGRIGQAIARRGAGFDMRVLYHNRRRLPLEAEAACGGAEYCEDVAALCARADFVVCAAPSTPDTRRLFSAALFAACKPGAVFINIARGDLVDQDALHAALASGHLGAAGLDVTTPEPLPRGHPLLTLKNVVLTPHTGSATLGTRAKMMQMALDNLLAGLNGEALLASPA